MQLPLAPPPPAKLPALQARWTQAVLGALPPSEPRSTCDACVKLAPPGEPMGPLHYHPDTKCCTYLPVLLNFQVGALLDDPEVPAEGRASVEWRIEQDQGVTPFGLVGHPGYYVRYTDEAFGKEPALVCPHYLPEQGGRCGVWQHRNAICSTWYCRTDKGGPAYSFWRLGLMRFLRAVEDAAAEWAIFALGAEQDEWGIWADRRAFYRAAARLVNGLSWEDTLALGGGKLHTLAGQAQELWRLYLEAPVVPLEQADGRPPSLLVDAEPEVAPPQEG